RPREGGVHHTLPVLPDVHHAGVVVDVDRHANPPAERKARCAGAERDRAAGVPDVRRGEAAARILEAEGDDALDPAAITVGRPQAQPAPAAEVVRSVEIEPEGVHDSVRRLDPVADVRVALQRGIPVELHAAVAAVHVLVAPAHDLRAMRGRARAGLLGAETVVLAAVAPVVAVALARPTVVIVRLEVIEPQPPGIHALD